MNKHVLLQTSEPMYGTYQYQASGCVVMAENPTMRNWYFNNCMMLSCHRKFLRGYTTPDVNIPGAGVYEIPEINKLTIDTRILKGCIHTVIKNMIDIGWYVEFYGIDDYYVKGKSWYKKLHIWHDGLICGYDDNDKTYYLSAYDENWVYRVFKTPQRCFSRGMFGMPKPGEYGGITGMKVKAHPVDLNLTLVKKQLIQYLSSDITIYPPEEEGDVFGIAVQEYICIYLDRLYDESIPYEKKDRRILRMVWEHKKCMQELIQAVEKMLGLDSGISSAYGPIVKTVNDMRMMYAKYILRRNNEILPLIKHKMHQIIQSEHALLQRCVSAIESGGF